MGGVRTLQEVCRDLSKGAGHSAGPHKCSDKPAPQPVTCPRAALGRMRTLPAPSAQRMALAPGGGATRTPLSGWPGARCWTHRPFGVSPGRGRLAPGPCGLTVRQGERALRGALVQGSQSGCLEGTQDPSSALPQLASLRKSSRTKRPRRTLVLWNLCAPPRNTGPPSLQASLSCPLTARVPIGRGPRPCICPRAQTSGDSANCDCRRRCSSSRTAWNSYRLADSRTQWKPHTGFLKSKQTEKQLEQTNHKYLNTEARN